MEYDKDMMLCTTDLNLSNPPHLQDLFFEGMGLSMGTSTDLQAETEAQRPRTPSGNCNSKEPTSTCMNSIFHALQNLHVPRPVCLSVNDDNLFFPSSTTATTNNKSRQMDTALTINRHVIDLISHVLQCPCSSASSVQLLLIILCERVVAWYQAMLNCDEHDYRSRYKYNNAETETSERVHFQPITMGDFTIDPVMQLRICDEVVMVESKRVEAVIRQFAARLMKTTNGERLGWASIQEQKMCAALTMLLRELLRARARICRRKESAWISDIAFY